MSECWCREFYCSTAKLPYALLGTLHHPPTFSAILLDVACFNMIHHNHHNHHRLVFHADRIPIKKKKNKEKGAKSSNISCDGTDYLMYEFLFFHTNASRRGFFYQPSLLSIELLWSLLIQTLVFYYMSRVSL